MGVISRLINATLNLINRYKKDKAASDPANTIANRNDGNRVRKSDKSYSDISGEPGSD